MDEFSYTAGRLHCEDVALTEIAERYGTPAYVYSRATLEAHYRRTAEAFAPLEPRIHYSVKACPNLHILRLLRELGSGFDVVSGGELHRALLAGAAPDSIVFAGVGKRADELAAAVLAGVGLINVESASELELLVEIAAARKARVDVALRLNPDVDAHTHEYTTTGRARNKFGLAAADVHALFERFAADPGVRLCGLHVHIGSPVNQPGLYVAALQETLEVLDALCAGGHSLDTLDIGGGFGAWYAGREAPTAREYAAAILPLLRGRRLRVILEPGRSIAANAGVLLTRVEHIKPQGPRRFVIVDASMNELMRPALYQAYHFIWPVETDGRVPEDRGLEQPFCDLTPADVVGPICESSDFLARDRMLPPLRRGDLLAVFTAGAYGSSMGSQYNSRPRAAEVLVDGAMTRLIRRRETFDDLVAMEQSALGDDDHRASTAAAEGA